MSAYLIFDVAPLGSLAAYSDGQPKPPARFTRKLAAWKSRNGVGRLVRKEPGELKPVDLNSLVRDSAHFVESDARQHGIRIQLDLAADLRPVPCNSVQIEQVLLNLLRNAVEAVQGAANGDGRIVIATAADAGRDAVVVSVCDNGVGLPGSSADVFAAFYSTKATGLGMGLSISRSIIEAHREFIAWLERSAAGESPAPAWDATSDDERASVMRLRDALSERGVPAPRAGLGRIPALLEALHFAGLKTPEQLESAFVLGSFAPTMAEALSWRFGEFRAYPMNLPRFQYEAGDG